MSTAAPFDFLSELANKVKAAAPDLPAQEDLKSSWSGIGFKILEQHMIAPLGEVVEMLEVPEVTRLPGVQPWVMGLANVRGRLIPIFDLEAFFGGKLTTNKVRHRILVLEMGELYAGLVVSEVSGLKHFDDDVEQIALPEKVSHLSPYSNGAYEQNGVIWMTFSPFNLVRDPRFFNAAAA